MDAAAALACAGLWAVSSVLQKDALRSGMPSRDLQLVVSATFFAGSLAWKLVTDGSPWPSASPRALALALGSGVLGFVAAYALLLWALTHAGVTRTIALSYTTPLFVLALAVVWLGERVTLRTALGALAVVAGGIAVSVG